MSVAAPVGFGGGLGAVIGANMASNDIDNRLSDINGTVSDFQQTTDPYNSFGQSFLNPATSAVTGVQKAANSTQGYNDFMSSYTNTPAAQYQVGQANKVQENSAAANGGVLSGSNLRSLATIDNGIVAGNANTAYNEYLQGNQQQFGQLESALGNMFSAIGVGQTATGQQDTLDAAKIGADTNIASTQQKNDQQKGAGIGSMFNGLGGASFGF